MPKIRPPYLGEQIGSLGEFIASQRRAAQLSLRQLAEQTGISNPYLSQIERGLRRPSAEVLQQLSKALRVSAETLYVRAGILDPRDHPATSVEMAVLADPATTERQKSVLIDIYASFVRENAQPAGRPTASEDAAPAAQPEPIEEPEASAEPEAAGESVAKAKPKAKARTRRNPKPKNTARSEEP
jgi:transcriptional regulator with XRE-family HTH domain